MGFANKYWGRIKRIFSSNRRQEIDKTPDTSAWGPGELVFIDKNPSIPMEIQEQRKAVRERIINNRKRKSQDKNRRYWQDRKNGR